MSSSGFEGSGKSPGATFRPRKVCPPAGAARTERVAFRASRSIRSNGAAFGAASQYLDGRICTLCTGGAAEEGRRRQDAVSLVAAMPDGSHHRWLSLGVRTISKLIDALAIPALRRGERLAFARIAQAFPGYASRRQP